jgi:AAHS family 4-hydroxybenzoate transporter-like MFS transporter
VASPVHGGWRGHACPAGRAGLATAGIAHVPKPGAATARKKNSIAFVQLLSPPLLFSTVLFAGLYAVNALVLYYVTSWVPTILPLAGFSMDTASRFLS